MSPWPAAFIFGVVLLTAFVFSRWLGAPAETGRFAAIDGLRGYLASGVLICHGSVWYFYLRTGKWASPPSHLYTNLGQGSVVLFFMITSFLFTSKLLRGRSEPFNWYKLYVSRLLRLLPLYAFALVLVGLTVAVVTGFQLQEPAFAMSKKAVKWATFSVLGAPDLNGVGGTFIIIAGVTWTLPYEWLFYLALPLLAALVGVVTPRRFFVGALIMIAVMSYKMKPDLIYLVAFAGGIIPALLIHLRLSPALFRGPAASVVAALSIATAVAYYPTAFRVAPIALLTIAFTLIAAGNSLFGILHWPASRFLGQLTYSIYLLHGVVLFWVWQFVLGFPRASAFSMTQHWAVIGLCVPVIIGLCCATFHYIELPGMRSVSHLGAWMRRRLAERRSAAR